MLDLMANLQHLPPEVQQAIEEATVYQEQVQLFNADNPDKFNPHPLLQLPLPQVARFDKEDLQQLQVAEDKLYPEQLAAIKTDLQIEQEEFANEEQEFMQENADDNPAQKPAPDGNRKRSKKTKHKH